MSFILWYLVFGFVIATLAQVFFLAVVGRTSIIGFLIDLVVWPYIVVSLLIALFMKD